MPDKHKYYTAQDQQRFLEGNTIEHMPSYQELTVECNVTWGNAGPPVVPAPTTLSRLLRLSRCMTSGRPVLIATYAGIEAASAAGVAAQLAGYHPLRFNCWNRLGEPNVVSQPGSGISLGAAEGAPPSEASLLALDSRYFMKRCILRAAGIKESYVDLPPSQAYRLRSSTVFETCPEERTVAIIAGLQEMPTTHRNDLLRFIGNDDPASFFTDYELIAIDLCLYETEVKKERAREQAHMRAAISASVSLVNRSENPSAFGSAAASATPSVVLEGRPGSAASATDSDYVPGVTPSLSNNLDRDGQAPVLGALNVVGAPPPVQNKGLDTEIPSLMALDEASGMQHDESEQAMETEGGVPPNASATASRRASPRPDGRALCSVRSFLKDKCDSNLRLVLTTEYPRPLKLNAIDEGLEDSRAALKHLKSHGSRLDSQSVMSMQAGASVVRKTKMDNIAALATRGGRDMGLQRRFSLINVDVQSQRDEENDINRQVSRSGRANAAPNLSAQELADKLLTSGSADVVHGANNVGYESAQQRKRTNSLAILTGKGTNVPKGLSEKDRAKLIEQGDKAPVEVVKKAGVEDEDWYKDLIQDDSTSIPDVLSCPVVGPMLRKYFDCMWYNDGEGTAVEMICASYLEEKPAHLDEDGHVDEECGGLNMDYRCNFALVVPSVSLMSRPSPVVSLPGSSIDDDDIESGANSGDEGSPWGGENPFDNRTLAEQTLPQHKLTIGVTVGATNNPVKVAEAEGASKEVDISIMQRPSIGAARSLHALSALGVFSSARKHMRPPSVPSDLAPAVDVDRPAEENSNANVAGIDGAAAVEGGATEGGSGVEQKAPFSEADQPQNGKDGAAAANTQLSEMRDEAPDHTQGAESGATDAGETMQGEGITKEEAETASLTGQETSGASSSTDPPMITAEFRSIANAVEDEFIRADFAERESVMRSEAMEILPALLTVPAPCDACLLNQPVVMFGPEEVAHRAARLVCLAIHEAVESLERRRIQLRIAKRELERAVNLVDKMSALVQGCEERALLLDAEAHAVSQTLTKIMIKCEEVNTWALGTPDAETQQMMREEQSATRRERCDPEAYDERLEELVHGLKLVKRTHVGTLATVFRVEIDDMALLTLVRAIVALIDFKPKKKQLRKLSRARRKSTVKKGDRKKSKAGALNDHEESKRKNGGASESTDESGTSASEAEQGAMDADAELVPNGDVCKYAYALFNSKDIISKICLMDPSLVGHGQRFRELKRQALRLTMLDPGSSPLVCENQDVVEITRLITSYVHAFVRRVEFSETQLEYFNQLREMDHVRDELRASVNRVRKQRGGQLEDERQSTKVKLTTIEHYASLCRSKGMLLGQLQRTHVDIKPQLEAALSFVEGEFIEAVAQRSTVVADVCVASVLLHRAGWMPEHVRAEVLEVLRNNLIDARVCVSETPYALGSLVDRRQIRRWTKALDRDVATINTLSLVHLNSDYAYVIDPDGSAVQALLNTCPDDYVTVSVRAAAFTFDILKNHVDEVRRDDKKGVYLVLTDTQTGVSADLVTLLNSELHTTHHTIVPQHHSHSPVPPGFEEKNIRGEMSTEEEYHVKSELYASVSGLGDSDCLAAEYGRVPLVPMRLVMVATTPPTVDEGGRGGTLPPMAFRRVTCIQWNTGATTGSYVEAKPMQFASNKNFVPDSSLEGQLATSLLSKLSPNHLSDLAEVNKNILDHQDAMYDIENRIARTLWVMYCCKQADDREKEGLPDAAELGLATPQEEEMEKMDMGLLIDGNSLACLHVSQRDRTHLAQELDNLHQQERDLLAYQTVIRELVFMAARFCRTAALIIPPSIVSPYAFTGRALALKGIEPTIDKYHKEFEGVPANLHRLRNFSRCIRKIQRNFKEWFQRKHEPDQHWTFKDGDELTGLQPSDSLDEDDSEGLAGGKDRKKSLSKVERAKRASQRKHKQRVHQMNKKLDSLIPLRHQERTHYMSDLAYLTKDLRRLLLTGMVEYVRNSIRPGYEWLVKFSLLLATWGTSSRPVPNDDLRIAVHNVMGSLGLTPPRYAHDVGIEYPNVEERPSQKLLDKVQLEQYGSSYGTKKRTQVRKSIHVARKKSTFLDAKHAFDVTSVLGRSQGSYHDTDTEALEGLSRRATELTVQRRTLRMSQVHSEKALDQASANAANKRARPGLPEKWSTGQWRQRGPGVIDGLWISESSTRWRINAVRRGRMSQVGLGDSNFGSFADSSNLSRRRSSLQLGGGGNDVLVKALIFEWNCTYTDVPGASNITQKSNLFKPTPRGIDTFEVEWLRCHGVKVFSLRPNISSNAPPGMYLVQMPRTRHVIQRTMHSSRNEDMSTLDTQIPGMKNSSLAHGASVSELKKKIASRRKQMAKGGRNEPKSKATLEKEMEEFRKKQEEAADEQRKKEGEDMRVSTANRISGMGSVNAADARKASATTRVMLKKKQNSGEMSMEYVAEAATEANEDDNEEGQVAGYELMGTTIVTDGDSKEHEAMLAKSRQMTAAATVLAMKVKFQKLFGNPKVQHYLNTMELHSSSKAVFSGISVGITQAVRAFEIWRASLDMLRSTRFNDQYENQLARIMERTTPPTLVYGWDDDDPDPSEGLWLQGKELTVIQSLQLAAVLAPESLAGIIEMYGAAMAIYLYKGGAITLHSGEEFMVATEAGSTASLGDITEGDEDEENGSSSADSDEEDSDDFSNSSDDFDVNDGDNMRLPEVCQDTEAFNAWTALRRMITGQDPVRKVRSKFHVNHGYSKSMLTPRDYDNWEETLRELLSVDSAAGRPLCVAEIAAAISRGHIRVMLAPSVPGLEIATSGWSRTTTTIATVLNKDITSIKFPRQDAPIRPAITEPHLMPRYNIMTKVETRPVRKIVEAIATSTVALNAPTHSTMRKRQKLHSSKGALVDRGPVSTFTELVDLDAHAAMSYMDALHDGIAAVSELRLNERRDNERKLFIHRRSTIAKGLDPRKVQPPTVTQPQPIGGHVIMTQMPTQNEHRPTLNAYLPANVADFRYVWLPRFSGADLVCSSDLPTALIDVSVPEATDTLMLELEQALLWVKQTARIMLEQDCSLIADLKFLTNGNAQQRSHEHLLRVVALVIFLWKSHTFLNSMKRDKDGKAGLWSLCTVSLDSWEISRLTTRIAAIMTRDWSSMIENYQHKNTEYQPIRTYMASDGEGRAAQLNALMEEPEFISCAERVAEVLVDLGTSVDYPEQSGRQALAKRLDRRKSMVQSGQARVGISRRRRSTFVSHLNASQLNGEGNVQKGSAMSMSPNKPSSPHKNTSSSPNQIARRLSMASPTLGSPERSGNTHGIMPSSSTQSLIADSSVASLSPTKPAIASKSPLLQRTSTAKKEKRSKSKKNKPALARTASKASKRRHSKINYNIKLNTELNYAADQRRLSQQIVENVRRHDKSSTPPGRTVLGSVGYFLGKLVLADRFTASRNTGGLGNVNLRDVIGATIGSDHRRHTVMSQRKIFPSPSSPTSPGSGDEGPEQGSGAAALFALETTHPRPEDIRVINVLPRVDFALGCMRAVDIAAVAAKWCISES